MTQQTDRLNTALAGHCRKLRQLGEGGMATVYLCEDLRHDRQVARTLPVACGPRECRVTHRDAIPHWVTNARLKVAAPVTARP